MINQLPKGYYQYDKCMTFAYACDILEREMETGYYEGYAIVKSKKPITGTDFYVIFLKEKNKNV